MNQFEEYKNNIEVTDKYFINDVDVKKSYIFSGPHKLFENNTNGSGYIRPLAAAVLGLDNTDIPISNDVQFHNFWTDTDAQESYLMLKPKTYLILGKQGTGCYSLGEAISKKMNCIHLCPKNVLIDEIEQKSITGRCLDFNMRHNKVCKFKVILSIMKEKLKSPAVQHRGFVISGFPLVISCKDPEYLINTLYGEESLLVVETIIYELLMNLKKKKSAKKPSRSRSSVSSENVEMSAEGEVEEEQGPEPEEDAEENENLIVELPKFLLEPCNNIIFATKVYYTTKKSVLLEQLHELFSLKPDILIYVTCPNKDAVTKRSRKFLSYLSNSNTFCPFIVTVEGEIRWPPSYSLTENKKLIDIYNFNPKYNCSQPINFRKNALGQICNFNVIVTSFVDEKLKEFDPSCIIKLDGRTSIYQMINHTMEILSLTRLKPVLIPEPLYLEEPPGDIEEFWSKVEDLNVIRSGVLSFYRYASAWYNRCPVELQKRQSTQGSPKFAVTFFKHIYLLSSLDAMISFCRNPRPFLKLEYLEPTCRIIILGTKSTGKTMVAKCLSWIFNAPIICYSKFLKYEKQKKYDNYAKNILSELIATIEDARFTKWQSLELERTSNLNTWFNTVSGLLSSYITLFKKINEQELDNANDFIFLNKYNALRGQLSFLPVDDLDECQNALLDRNLLKYAPSSLIIETNKPTIPMLGDDDVTREIQAYIVANELQKEIEPTAEELMTEIIKRLHIIDSKSANNLSENVYGKFIIDGFPSNPEYWAYLNESRLLPDFTIALMENREIDVDLIHHYIKIETCEKNYQERYLLANDILVKIKLHQDNPPDTSVLDMEIIVNESIEEALNNIILEQKTETLNDSDLITSFTETIEKFREDWEIIKLKIEENFKIFIEVELGEKSDVEILDEVLLQIRKGYCRPCIKNEEELENLEVESESKDVLTYNDPLNLGETNVYCPISFYDYGVLWEGKPEFSIKYENKLYYFSKEEYCELLEHDVTKYLSYNRPFKNIPPLRICIIGSIGSGKTTLAKVIAKELGLIHIDFANFINDFLIPKHFKKIGWDYENSFTDTLFDEEETVDFQIDEENLNIFSDILSNEQELRKMVYNYLERGSPLLSILIQSLIKKLWFESPFKNAGIVIDGFPKLPSDFEDMITCSCIPDIVIELEGSSETTLERLSPIKLKKWKAQLSEAKLKAKIKLDAERKAWQNYVTKTVVIKLIMDEILGNVVPHTEEPNINLSEQVSTIIDANPSGSSNVDASLFTTYHDFIQEYPEPVDQNIWEKAEDALEKITNRLESIYEIDDENIQSLKDTMEDQNMKLISLDGRKVYHKVLRRALLNLSKLRSRCESFFEQTIIINCDIAEMLILEGFFLLSKFNRMCPVFISEHPHITYNTYNINKRKNKISPIIHRAYIYFISSEENVKKFRENPLKYIQYDAINSFKPFPLRLSVIGPPKSGKSKLSAKLAKQYGLMCISKGMAIRHVLENMYWTALGTKILTSLHEGECINSELIMMAVLTVSLDNRIVTNGFVLDGFPESPYEVQELSKNGLFPIIVFDLDTNKEKVLENSQLEIHYDILKVKPPYAISLIEYKYNRWYEKYARVRDWINNDTHNIFVVNGNNSKWKCFDDACKKVEDIILKIHYYLTQSDSKAVCVDSLCISKDTFQQRMSCYLNLCPVCFHKNYLRQCGYPHGENGVVQYNGTFYWICVDHLDLVLKYPQEFLCNKKIIIPEIPALVKSVNMSLVYENGICIVTYAENLPSQKIVRGKNEYAASYKKQTYLLCSLKCLSKFLVRPHMYYNIKVFNKEIDIFPKMTLKTLPHLGYLEQTVGNILTNACCAVNVLRPKYPGLDTYISALLYIAFYLKVNNPLSNKLLTPLYEKAFKIFEARCNLIKNVGLQLRSADNPFANYPKCCNKLNKTKEIHSGTVKKPSSIVSTSTSSVYVESDFTKLL